MLALFGSVGYVILASKYLRILQENLLEKLIQINNQIQTKTGLNYKSLRMYYGKYILANRELIQINLCIQSYARHCAPILSTMFPFYISSKFFVVFNWKITAVKLTFKNFDVFLKNITFFTFFVSSSMFSSSFYNICRF